MSNGDIVKVALIMVDEAIEKEKWDAKILLSVYDEIQTECIEAQADGWCKRLEEIMIAAARVVVKDTPIEAKCSVNDYWKK